MMQSAGPMVLQQKQVLWKWARWHDWSNPGDCVIISRIYGSCRGWSSASLVNRHDSMTSFIWQYNFHCMCTLNMIDQSRRLPSETSGVRWFMSQSTLLNGWLTGTSSALTLRSMQLMMTSSRRMK